MPALKKRPKATAAASAAASPSSSSPSELAELLLADPVANANLLPKLLALEAVPSDDVRSSLSLLNLVGRLFMAHLRLLPPSSLGRPLIDARSLRVRRRLLLCPRTSRIARDVLSKARRAPRRTNLFLLAAAGNALSLSLAQRTPLFPFKQKPHRPPPPKKKHDNKTSPPPRPPRPPAAPSPSSSRPRAPAGSSRARRRQQSKRRGATS